MKDKKDCNVYVMPPAISDEDITALFNGIMKVVKHKMELDTKAQILSLNLTQEKLVKELKAKTNECIRLKNEIIYLKSQLAEK